jgi:dipeptidyl aminopeptidase/acylaminoacyl peptidase
MDTSPRPKRSRRWALARAVLIAAAMVLVVRMTGCMERLFYFPLAERTPPPADAPGAESVWFESADGTRLHGWFIPAAPGSTPTGATVVHAHGNAGNVYHHLGFTDFLPEAGFNLFLFDYRGYGQSEGHARRRGPLIADTHAAIDAMMAREGVDPQRVALFAQSLGGAIGLNVMADRDDLRAGVIVSAFTSWREMGATAVGGDPPNPIGRALGWLLVSDAMRPIDAIARIDRPVLLVHGSADEIIPVSHGRRLAGAAGETVEYVELEGGDHNDIRNTAPGFDRLVVDFLQRHLAAPPG